MKIYRNTYVFPYNKIYIYFSSVFRRLYKLLAINQMAVSLFLYFFVAKWQCQSQKKKRKKERNVKTVVDQPGSQSARQPVNGQVQQPHQLTGNDRSGQLHSPAPFLIVFFLQFPFFDFHAWLGRPSIYYALAQLRQIVGKSLSLSGHTDPAPK